MSQVNKLYEQEVRDKRILHCPENLGNNAKRLAQIERSQGAKSWSVSLRKEAFGFEADQTLVPSSSFILGELARWRLLWIALSQYDIIHFNNGKTIMPHRLPFHSVKKRTNSVIACFYYLYSLILEGKDLWLLKLFNKTIYFTFQGSDARFSSHYTNLHSPEVLNGINTDYLSSVADSFKKKRIERAKKYANKIFAMNPDLLKNLGSKCEFLPYYNVDVNKISAHPILQDDAIHIVHAPSKKDIKGTKYIVKAIGQLQKTHTIKFTLVEGLSNEEAQKIYDTADILIDQLLVGWYGGVAVELMARGVPVVCFLHENDFEQIDEVFINELPIINSSVDSIYDDLQALLTRPKAELQELGNSSRRFIEKYHHIC